ncbi:MULTISPECIES: SMP-30/gluconolactonase/LRE family protein [Streptomyces]|uniref:SMP-30/gluconolactonase/LRE family protein n=1 Tax=Streptomyces TaxID=1883 RepID=UPI000F656A93|nr:superoxide dismutase [Streptomyces alboflavus]
MTSQQLPDHSARSAHSFRPSRRALLAGAGASALGIASGAAFAGNASARAASDGAAAWPTTFPLPNGFQPEGIAIGRAPYAYLGSLGTGAVYRADLRTGRGELLHPGVPGVPAVGMKVGRDGLLYVAGGASGSARVLDLRTGAIVATYQLAAETGHFVNDVHLGADRAWFTDSSDRVLYGVPLGRGGQGDVRHVRLGGDWQQEPGVFNANGITSTPDGRALIVVSSQPVGRLYRVDPRTGHADEIRLKGADGVPNGDGLVRVGRTLFVVQNRFNVVTGFRLGADGRSAALRHRLTDPRFDIPATAARFGDRLYLVNARFTTPPTPDTTYDVVAVPLPGVATG